MSAVSTQAEDITLDDLVAALESECPVCGAGPNSPCEPWCE
jgi:hypothetical protein